MRRVAGSLLTVAALGAVSIVAPPGANGQAPAQPAGTLGIEGQTLLLDGRFQVQVPWRLDFGVTTPPQGNGQPHYYFSSSDIDLLTRLLSLPPCFPDNSLPGFGFCPVPPVRRFVIRLGPLDDRLKIRAEVPKLPAKPRIDGLTGDDQIEGGRNNETINAGAGDDKAKGGDGNDRLDGGDGKDVLIAGAGNDSVMSRDGATDNINCGPGRRDLVKPDRADKLKGCEIVR